MTTLIKTQPLIPPTSGHYSYGVELELMHTRGRNAAAESIREALPGQTIHASTEAYGERGGFRRWNVIPDYSLSGGGVEVVSPVIKTAQDEENLKTVCRVLRETGGRIRSSCGLHVTVGLPSSVRPEQYEEVARRLAFAWSHIQDDIFRTLSRSRQNNRFCERLFYGDTPINFLDTESDHLSRVRGRKFSALNLSKLFRHRSGGYRNSRENAPKGLVEFRCHQGTLNARKVLNWARFCRSFVKSVLEMPLKKGVAASQNDFNRRGLGGIQGVVSRILENGSGTTMRYRELASLVAEEMGGTERPRRVRGAVRRLKRRGAPIVIGRASATWMSGVSSSDGEGSEGTPHWDWKMGLDAETVEYLERRAASFGRTLTEVL